MQTKHDIEQSYARSRMAHIVQVSAFCNTDLPLRLDMLMV